MTILSEDERIRSLLDFESPVWTRKHVEAVVASNVRDFKLLEAMKRFISERNRTPLMFAAVRSSAELVQLFIKEDLGKVDSQFKTALMYAA